MFSKTLEEHIQHLSAIFDILQNEGLKLKLSKCHFFKKKLKYLGHVITVDGFKPDEKKIKSIKDYPAPLNIKQLLAFLGLVNYYRKFLKGFADLAHYLTELTKKATQWVWGERERDAFQRIKDALTTNPLLRYPDFSREFVVYADASGYGIGAVLAQVQDLPPSELDPTQISGEHEVVIAYASRHLTERERTWNASEKECLAIVFALKQFRCYLYGRTFKIYTDHKPLESLMNKKDPHGRLARWAYEIQTYDMTVLHRPGQENQNADALSRAPLPTIGVVTQIKQEKIQND